MEDRTLLATVIPNDPLFVDQWNLHNTGQRGGLPDVDIDAPEAWSLTTGSTSTVVAVIDNGVEYTHEDLYLNIWINEGEIPELLASALSDGDGDGLITFRDLNDPANASLVSDLNGTGYIDAGDLLADSNWEDGIDTDANGYIDDLVGWDWVDGDNDPIGTYDHGTAMAGIIGAAGDNGLGMAGVNWEIRLMPLRHKIGDGSDSNAFDNAPDAIDYAVDMGASISNNSWGFDEFSQEVYDAIDRARLAGHLIVTAAGNQTRDVDAEARYPASYDLDNILVVTGTDENNQLLSNYNWGLQSVDVAVPTIGTIKTRLNNTYGTGSGTSNSSALVTGVAALVKSVNPSWNADQIKSRIMSTVVHVPELAGLTVTGGQVNAAASVAAKVAADDFESGTFTGGSEQWVTGAWTASGDASIQSNSPHSGTYEARLRSGSGDLIRTVDTTGVSDVRLQFWARLNSFENNDKARVKVSSDGSNWTTVLELGNGQDDNQYHFYEVDISNVSDTLYVRFDAGMNKTNDQWYVDDVEVFTIALDPPPPPGITVSPTSGLQTTEAGGTANFTVVLDSQPTTDVTIGVSSNDASEGTVLATSLTFTTANWNLPQLVTVTGVDDPDEDGDVAYTVITAPATSTDPAYNGLDPSDVTVTNVDDDGSTNPNTLYVSDISFDSKRGGKDWRAVFQIRSDSDGDGQASASDDVAAGVTITVEFNGTEYTGTTDSNGIFRTSWNRNLSSGDYYADVLNLALAGFVWNPLDLDVEDDSDGDGLPDDLLVV